MNQEILNVGRFELWGAWTPELIPAIRPLLEKWEVLLPSWCEVAHVEQLTDERTAECGVDLKYRRVRLSFGMAFFSSSEGEREAFFIHELMHSQAHHLFWLAYDTVGELTEGNPLACTLARKALEEANEGVTSDLTALILRLTNKR